MQAPISLHSPARASPIQERIVVRISISTCGGVIRRGCSRCGLRGGGEFGTLKRHTKQSRGTGDG